MKIVTVIGARPQFIKASVVSRAFTKLNIEEIIIHTGQHHDSSMSDVFFEEMEIPKPAYFLDVHGLSHGAMTGRMLESIEDVLIEEKPNAVLVYGDTNSTLAGALAAAKLHIPVAHIEAGLRSFNRAMPEELNRILTDQLSDYLYCPSVAAIENVKREGFFHQPKKIIKTGDVMFDAFTYYQKKAEQKSNILHVNLLQSNQYALLTLHRAENADDENRLQEILNGIEQLAQTTTIIWPVHPRLNNALAEFTFSPNIKLIAPVGYFDMIQLLQHAAIVLTDSGGLQKEAYFARKYCITLRDQTEWVELVHEKANFLTGANAQAMVNTYHQLVNQPFPTFNASLYGDGHTAEAIVKHLIENI
ncbi:MAG: UDP-N-acetylglucosamine 2-epimerase (non-hydrolyzing) [Cyclobacteriaceae bacterium]|jgi:UDP-GlcNAc3NAcA epimerase|nr:UDP-N-acetylglucosamine 2-epimerase (non-hydrolyzing) [Cyclobacteriaceae bacterium]